MYKITSGPVGSDHLWNIINTDTKEVIAKLHGPESGIVALAACEALNAGFDYFGWTQRLASLTKQ